MPRRIPRELAERIISEVRRRITFGDKRLPTTPVGSVRRKEPTAKDLDLLVIAPTDKIRGTALPQLRLVGRGNASITKAATKGAIHRMLVLRWAPSGIKPFTIKLDVFICTRAEKPYALFHYTGNRAYNIRTRALAKRRGLLMNQYGIFDRKTRLPVRGASTIKKEKDVARFLGVTYRSPSNRTG